MTKERALKAASLLLKRSQIYRGQALELDPQNETLKAYKARDLLKTFLAAKLEIDERYSSRANEESEADEEEEDDFQWGPKSFYFSCIFCNSYQFVYSSVNKSFTFSPIQFILSILFRHLILVPLISILNALLFCDSPTKVLKWEFLNLLNY